jgi:hypothetical protein
MRWVLAVLVLLIPAAFVVGRETSSSTTSTRTTSSTHVYTVRGGDVVRVPTAATRCEASYDGGFPNFFCSRKPEGRYQVVFYKDSVLVSRVGDPDNPPQVFRWEP